MCALSIRQPWAELILRGVKTVEYRSRPTRVIGERFHIYVPLKHAHAECEGLVAGPGGGSGDQRSGVRGQESESGGQGSAVRRVLWLASDLRPLTSEDAPPEWLLELAEQLRLIEPGTPLPTGVIVGSAVIEKVTQVRDQESGVRDQESEDGLTSDLRRLTSVFAWHLAGVQRADRPRKPTRHPQPAWFRPF